MAMTSQMRQHLVHAGWLAAALAVLGGVFALYTCIRTFS
jgi:hypothetical protein